MSSPLPRLARAVSLCALVVSASSVVVAAQDSRRDDEDFLVAMGLLQRGLHDEAARQLSEFLRARPESPRATEAWYRLGTCKQDLNELDAAVSAFRTALGRPGEFALRAECRYRLGNALKDQKHYQEASEQYRALVQETAADHYLRVPSLYAAAECARELGRDDDAVSLFVQSADADHDANGAYAMPALYQAGFAHLRQGRFGEAADAFARAAERFPNHAVAAECRYLEGEAAFRGHDLDRAAEAYRRVLAGEWADDAAMGSAWTALEKGDDAQALQHFRRAAQFADSPHTAKAHLEAGRILQRTGESDAAIAELAAISDDNTPAEVRSAALELVGLAHLAKGRAEAAAAQFERALACCTDDALRTRLGYDQGEALAELERWEPALAAYRGAEGGARGELLGDVLYGECLALHKVGRLDESIACAEKLLAADAKHRLAARARFAIGENLFAGQRYPQADQAYAQVGDAKELTDKVAFKRAWCSYLGGDAKTGAARFAAIEGDAFAEEALSMAALANLDAEQMDAALDAADRYRARYPRGQYLARTERVAARVLRARGELRAAAQRIAAAAQAAGAEHGGDDRLEEAELLFQQGDYQGAGQRYRALAERTDAVGLKAREGMAWCAFELGNDQGCLEQVDAALARQDAEQRRAPLLELRLATLHRAERWADAVQTAQQFLAAFPDHERADDVALGMAVAQGHDGDHAAARRTLAALVQRPGLKQPGRVYYEWAWACQRDGDEAAALDCFAKLVGVDDDVDRVGEARLHLGLAALAKHDVAAARTLFAQVQGRYRGQAQYRLGFSYLDDHQPQTALEPFAAVVSLGRDEPLYAEAVFLCGECEFLQQRYDQAAARYQEMLSIDAEHARAQRARVHLGQCLVRTDRAGEALAPLEDFLRRGGVEGAEEAEGNLWLGKARLARGESERAEAALQRATELSEGELAAEAQFCIGEARRVRGDETGAVDAFVKLSVLYAHEQWVRRGLLEAGLGYLSLQQPAKAQKFLSEVVDRFPDSDEAGRARAAIKDLQAR